MILLQVRKLLVSIMHPECWGPLLLKVAPTIDHLPILRGMEVGAIIDVGANRGQFALACRVAKLDVPIFAFEPIPGEAAVFGKVHQGCPSVRLFRTALGPEEGTATLHLSGRADSSSLLEIGEAQATIFAGTSEVSTITVPVKLLDSFAGEWERYSNMLLKLDVQGFELKVLEGAIETLEKCRYVYAECSEKELYVGQALYGEVASFLNRHGFRLKSRHNDFIRDGQLIQADYLFERVSE